MVTIILFLFIITKLDFKGILITLLLALIIEKKRAIDFDPSPLENPKLKLRLKNEKFILKNNANLFNEMIEYLKAIVDFYTLLISY